MIVVDNIVCSTYVRTVQQYLLPTYDVPILLLQEDTILAGYSFRLEELLQITERGQATPGILELHFFFFLIAPNYPSGLDDQIFFFPLCAQARSPLQSAVTSQTHLL